MVIRGYGAAGMVPFDSPVEVFLPCWPWGAYLGDHAMESGCDTCVSSWSRMAPNTTPSMAKIAGNYLGGQLIKMEALQNGYDEAIALGPDGMISEGSGQNVFIVYKGVVYTTPLNGTLLPGITRDSLITLARDAKLEVREMPLQRDFLYAADEIFLTGTASEVTPVRSVDRLAVGDGRVGEVTKLLQRTFLDIVHGRAEDRHNWLCHVRAERASAT
jgi:branched-chain amino acid aminotransferase